MLNWVWAIYIEMTSLKGVSSIKLHRGIGVTQATAWFMLQRIREAFWLDELIEFEGPVELDESTWAAWNATSTRTRKPIWDVDQ